VYDVVGPLVFENWRPTAAAQSVPIYTFICIYKWQSFADIFDALTHSCPNCFS